MATSPNDLTRQQLDELDALLQRMLAVPIAAVEPAPPEPPVAGTWRMDPPAPVMTRTPHLTPAAPAYAEPAFAGSYAAPAESAVILETRFDPRGYSRSEPVAIPDPTPAPRLFGAEPSVPPPIQSRTTPPMPGPSATYYETDDTATTDDAITVDPPAVTFQPATILPTDVSADSAAVPLAMAAATAPAGEIPLPLLPVYGANKLLEGVLCLFGPPGEFFCHPAVKWLLGLGGLGLLGYAAFWAARGMGWLGGMTGG